MPSTPYVFRATRVNTTLATLIVTGFGVACARLIQGGTVGVSLSLHDSATVTTAATMVAELGVSKDGAATEGTDELSVPVRFQTGLKVKLNVVSGAIGDTAAYIYVA
jgi:hypothetical protein